MRLHALLFFLLNIVLVSSCSQVLDIPSSREITHYWSKSEIPNQINVYLQSASDLSELWGWSFPDFQWFSQSLVKDDYRHAIMASPYINQEMRFDLLKSENQANQDFNSVNQMHQMLSKRESLIHTGMILRVLFETQYPEHMFWWAGWWVSISWIPNDKKSLLSYPLVLSTEITYYGTGTEYGFSDRDWSIERVNRLMEKDWNTWSATGMINTWNSTRSSSPVQSTTVRIWFQESEISRLSELRIRIFPKEYSRDSVIPLVVLHSSWILDLLWWKNLKFFLEKNWNITREIESTNSSSSNENASDNFIKLKNFSLQDADTVLIRGVY